VGGDLYLRSLTSIPEGFNPTVGGYLYLRSLTSIPEGFNPTVGGDLYLESLTSIPEGFNPTVGGDLYLGSGMKCESTKLPSNHVFSWQGGKYVNIDHIFCEVVSNRGSVWKVKKINQDKVFYIVTDGEKFAHGDTIKAARESLIFKIKDRDTSKYKGLKKSSKLSYPEMIQCYRTITGACEFGVRNFISSQIKGKPKAEYKIAEVIKLTQNQFGNNTFSQFFA
jgi:hypothetical protein